MTHEVKDKVFLITGGASGLGALVTRALLEEGAKHVAILDIAKEPGLALEKELNIKHGKNKIKYINCDVTDDDHLFSAFDIVVKENGYIDAVINNAGIMNDSPKMYKKQIVLNVVSLVTSTLKALELMGKDNGGRGGTVVNISSIAGLVQSPLIPIYFATKSAVLQFSNCIGMEPNYSRTGVRVVTVCFGATDTPLLSEKNMLSFDKTCTDALHISRSTWKLQKPESAVKGLLEAFKRGASASTWIAISNNPVVDITENIKEGFATFMKGIDQ